MAADIYNLPHMRVGAVALALQNVFDIDDILASHDTTQCTVRPGLEWTAPPHILNNPRLPLYRDAMKLFAIVRRKVAICGAAQALASIGPECHRWVYGSIPDQGMG